MTSLRSWNYLGFYTYIFPLKSWLSIFYLHLMTSPLCGDFSYFKSLSLSSPSNYERTKVGLIQSLKISYCGLYFLVVISIFVIKGLILNHLIFFVFILGAISLDSSSNCMKCMRLKDKHMFSKIQLFFSDN